MDYMLIEQEAFEELKGLIGRLVDHVSQYRDLTNPATYPR